MRLSTHDMVKVSLFASLTAAGSFVCIPLPLNLVPITLQTFFTYLSGIVLGPLLGPLSQLIYILLGCLNLPVFAGGTAGVGILFGPTGGYLWGFLAASGIIGFMVRGKRNFWWLAMALVIGTMAIYLCGLIQLIFVARLSLVQAFWTGMVFFLPGDLMKIVLASQVALKLPQKLTHF
ncbi:MAG: biotin transporter BioY [bacterium]|nr:biotin transporter BioY [bacterium]